MTREGRTYGSYIPVQCHDHRVGRLLLTVLLLRILLSRDTALIGPLVSPSTLPLCPRNTTTTRPEPVQPLPCCASARRSLGTGVLCCRYSHSRAPRWVRRPAQLLGLLQPLCSCCSPRAYKQNALSRTRTSLEAGREKSNKKKGRRKCPDDGVWSTDTLIILFHVRPLARLVLESMK